eukprot:scaffold18138_cov128-Cylindrotheca_fusiformis.AAC.6
MELYNDSVANAIESWKNPSRRAAIQRVSAVSIIFKLAPGAISMFGFGEGVDERNIPETLFKLPTFQRHTVAVISRLESALAMMVGDDMESLANTLSDLGSKHIVYGVRPAHYLVVEAALVRTLQLGLKDQWTTSIKKDWAAVCKFVARAMMSGAENRVEIVKSTRRNTEHKKVATLRLKAITPSKRTEALSRQSRCSATSRFDGVKLRLPGRCSSDPPRRPSRGWLHERYGGKGWDDIGSASDLSSKGTNTTRSMMSGDSGYWFWGDSSIEPPRMPQRKSLTVSTQNAANDSHRQYPGIPSHIFLPTMKDEYSFQSVRVLRVGPELFPPSVHTAKGTSSSIRFGPVHSLDKTPISPRRRRSPPRCWPGITSSAA